MRRKEIVSFIPYFKHFFLTICVLIMTAVGVCAQSPATAQPSPAPGQSTSTAAPPAGDITQPAPNPAQPAAGADIEALRKRIERARALAAAHQLTAAASELESMRASVKDDVVRNLSSVMLIGIYLEDGNYARAESLVEEAYKACASRNEAAMRVYFALAGQAVNGARSHLARYRTFGIDVSNATLPSEATNDLDRLRSFLERVIAQAKDLIKDNAKGYDVLALIEDAAGVRAMLARDNDDRARWEGEYAAAREKLAASQMQVASISGIPSLGAAFPSANNARPVTTPAPAATDGANNSANESSQATPEPSPESQSQTPSPIVTGGSKSPNLPTIFEVGSLTERATKRVVPIYPQLARSANVSGLVRVKVIVDESGGVANIAWVEGPMLLRQAAQDAARHWKFQPTVMEG